MARAPQAGPSVSLPGGPGAPCIPLPSGLTQEHINFYASQARQLCCTSPASCLQQAWYHEAPKCRLSRAVHHDVVTVLVLMRRRAKLLPSADGEGDEAARGEGRQAVRDDAA